jgi:hypothetical protein
VDLRGGAAVGGGDSAVGGLEAFTFRKFIRRNPVVQIRSVDWTNGFWVINLRTLRDGGDYGRVP